MLNHRHRRRRFARRDLCDSGFGVGSLRCRHPWDSTGQPGMHHAVLQFQAFQWVHLQQAADHVLGFFGDTLPSGRGHAVAGRSNLLLQRHRFAIEGISPTQHDEEHRTQAPVICRLSVATSASLYIEDLRGPVLWRPHEGLREGGALVDDLGQAEVRDLHLAQRARQGWGKLATGSDENVLGLEIPVDHILAVHVPNAFKELSEDVLGFHFIEGLVAYDDIEELSAPHQLHD
mmetsp:Transcript_4861/g.10373  ORF Transcript_4861/g.10373 Transcript_4861/m.10373 type:complete len:232 (+) Transcript_4861:187-882(+)